MEVHGAPGAIAAGLDDTLADPLGAARRDLPAGPAAPVVHGAIPAGLCRRADLLRGGRPRRAPDPRAPSPTRLAAARIAEAARALEDGRRRRRPDGNPGLAWCPPALLVCNNKCTEDPRMFVSTPPTHHPPHRRLALGGYRRSAPARSSTRRPASRPVLSTSRRPHWSTRSWPPPRPPGSPSGAHLADQADAVLFKFSELLNERKEEIAAVITAEHGKVLSDAIGEVTRGLEVAEFACGIPHLLKGGFSEKRLDQGRCLFDSAESGRGRGDQPVQLPGDGAALVRPDRPRLRQCGHHQALGEGPVGRQRRRRPVEGSRAARRHPQCRPRRQGSGRRPARQPRRPRRLLRRLDSHREVRLREGHGQRQARPGPRWREEPHARPARRRPRSRRRRSRQRWLRLRR
jgi:hypothetical protein